MHEQELFQVLQSIYYPYCQKKQITKNSGALQNTRKTGILRVHKSRRILQYMEVGYERRNFLNLPY